MPAPKSREGRRAIAKRRLPHPADQCGGLYGPSPEARCYGGYDMAENGAAQGGNVPRNTLGEHPAQQESRPAPSRHALSPPPAAANLPIACFIRGPCAGRPVSTLQAPRLESLIADRISSLGYVSRVGYSDDGQEVTILVIHDDDPERDSAMVREIGNRGTEIEHEIPDRMISPLAIQDGPDLPEGILAGCKPVYTRETGR